MCSLEGLWILISLKLFFEDGRIHTAEPDILSPESVMSQLHIVIRFIWSLFLKQVAFCSRERDDILRQDGRSHWHNPEWVGKTIELIAGTSSEDEGVIVKRMCVLE